MAHPTAAEHGHNGTLVQHACRCLPSRLLQSVPQSVWCYFKNHNFHMVLRHSVARRPAAAFQTRCARLLPRFNAGNVYTWASRGIYTLLAVIFGGFCALLWGASLPAVAGLGSWDAVGSLQQLAELQGEGGARQARQVRSLPLVE